MKFIVARDVFAEAVTWTTRTLPQRPAVPILGGVKLQAELGVVTLSCFDFEVSARCEITADIEQEGQVLVSGRLLAEIARSLPPKPVELNLEGTKVSITCGSSRFSLMTMPLDDYPKLPVAPASAGSIDASEFSHAVNQVTLAVSKDETLPLLTAVMVVVEGEKMTLMATDRYRLALRELSWNPSRPDFEGLALIKGKTLAEIAKSLPSTGTAQISLTPNNEEGGSIIGIEAAGRKMTSQLTDGEYPPVARLFPETTPITAVVERSEFIEALKRVRLVADKGAAIRCVFNDDSVILEAGQGEDAQASEEIAGMLTGEDITTGFNPDYLLDGLGAMDEKFVRLGFTHASKASVITGQKEAGSGEVTQYRYLLMPIRYGS